MTDKKISDLTARTTLDETEEYAVAQAGANYKVLGWGAQTSALASPGAPVLSYTGAAGATSRIYAIGAVSTVGETLVGATATINGTAATLDGTHFVTLTWAAVPGATSYDVWGTSPPRRIAKDIAALTYDDVGTREDTSLPITNTTAGFYTAKHLRVSGHSGFGPDGKIDGQLGQVPGSNTAAVLTVAQKNATTGDATGMVGVKTYLGAAEDGVWASGQFMLESSSSFAGTITGMGALLGDVEHSGTGNNSYMGGVDGVFSINGAGATSDFATAFHAQGGNSIAGTTITEAYQFRSQPGNWTGVMAGNITTFYQFAAEVPTGLTGTIGTHYGFYCADLSGSGTTNYNFYSAGATTSNLFEGPVTLGKATVASGSLKFKGTTSGTATLASDATASLLTLDCSATINSVQLPALTLSGTGNNSEFHLVDTTASQTWALNNSSGAFNLIDRTANHVMMVYGTDGSITFKDAASAIIFALGSTGTLTVVQPLRVTSTGQNFIAHNGTAGSFSAYQWQLGTFNSPTYQWDMYVTGTAGAVFTDASAGDIGVRPNADANFWFTTAAGATILGVRKGGGLQMKVVTFATLPGSPVAGTMVPISDSNTGVFGATITAGGGTNKGLAYYDGTNWTYR